MKKSILYFLFFYVVSLSNAQTQYSSYGKEKHGKYTYTKVSNDPTNTRWYVLENGLTVILSVNKNQPRIQTLIATKAGSKNDPSDNTGLAHYLEHMLFKGTDKYGTQDFAQEKIYLDKIDALYEKYNQTKDEAERKKIYREIDSISGIAAKYSIANEYDKVCQSIGANGTNAFTSVEQTVYLNNIPSNMLHQWVELEAERYRNPILRLFHTELEAVYEEKNISLDSDGDEAYEKLYASLFRAHPYGTQTTIGTIEHLKNPSLKKIRDYYNTYYVPNNMAIILSGDFEYDVAIEMIDKHFSYMKPKPLPAFTFQPEYPRGWKDSISVVGPDAANVMIAWRIDHTNKKHSVLISLIDLILNNSKAGLIDLNLVKEQKVLSASSGPDIMKDYSVHLLTGKPKQGQSLEEVSQLLLSQIEKIKKGDFDDKIIKSIIANNEVEQTQKLESAEGVAYSLLNSFVLDQPWMKSLNENYEMSKITKEEIIEFANEYYNSGYSIVYKRTGEDSKIEKIEKPQITEVELNRDKTSSFVKELLEEDADTILPVYLNFEKDIEKGIVKQKVPLLYKKNETNKLFSLYYVIESGKYNDKKLPFALDYLQFIGTDKYSASELSLKFYELACNYGISAGENRSYVYLNGPQENFEKALELFEHLLSNAKPDQTVLNNYIERQLKSRNDAKLNKRAITSALSLYALYGKVNPRTYTLTNAELKALTANDLVNTIKKLTNYKHQIFYYGPKSKGDIENSLNLYHKVPELIIEPSKSIEFVPQTTLTNKVYFTHYEMVQADINWRLSGNTFNNEMTPVSRLFNEYFGGGMSSVVFQEIRESRALAYSTNAYFSQGNAKNKKDVFSAFVGTQADKFHEAIKAMFELLNQMPTNEESFNQAKQAVLSNISAERIIKSDVFFTYLSSIDLGLTNDNRQYVYEKIKSLTLNDIKAFHEKNIQNKKWIISVVGSKEKLKEQDLKKYGELQIVTLEEIFGY